MSELLDNLRVVLVATRNPLNMGAVARAMSNFGSEHLRVVTPYEKAYREAVSAVGASAVMKEAEEFAGVAEAVADCSLVVGTTAVGNREIRQPLRSLEEAGPLLRKRLKKSKVALLFGSEKRGLSNESLSHCHWLLRIPTREEHRSMNLGQAAAVCLYELGREEFTTEGTEDPPRPGRGERRSQRSQRRGEVESSKLKVEKGKRRKELTAETQRTRRNAEEEKSKTVGFPRLRSGQNQEHAPMETVERIGEALLKALQQSGYVAPRGSDLAEEKLRRMLRRFTLEEGDAEVLLGMMRKILWKLEEEE